MDRLAWLGEVHGALDLMAAHGVHTPSLANDRMLAECLVALNQFSGDGTKLQSRCAILLESLPQVPVVMLHQLSAQKTGSPLQTFACSVSLIPQIATTNEPRQGQSQRKISESHHCISFPVGKAANPSVLALPNQTLRGQAGLQQDQDFTTFPEGQLKGAYGNLARACADQENGMQNVESDHSQERNTFGKPAIGEAEPSTLDVMIRQPLRGYAAVGLKAMERARSTLEDFHSSYFMFHGLNACSPEDIFRYFPIFAFVEAFIYELDEQNEESLLPPAVSLPPASSAALLPTAPLAMETAPLQQPQDEESPFAPLEEQLQERGLLTERLRMEFRSGVEFWRLERRLCGALAANKAVQRHEVLKALQLKSFDYRVLNLLLYQMRRSPVNETHFRFLGVSELLVEIGDDLFDYEEDIVSNAFNILRLFVAIDGPKHAPAELAKYIGELEREYERLMLELEPDLAELYRKRCRDATRQGGGGGGESPMGAWSIPPIVVDEEAFRAHVRAADEQP